MSSPFPGMNPYLEHPELWSEVHHRLITAIADALAPDLLPKYRVAIEKRIYSSEIEDDILIGLPDVSIASRRSLNSEPRSTVMLASLIEPMAVTVPMLEEAREGYLEIREVSTGKVVTAIEIVSPKNKQAGKGREAYEKKRQKILASSTHLVEIDLIRSGKPMRIIEDVKSDYRILISRGNRRPRAYLYAFSVRDPIPSFPLPLQSGDREPLVQLQELLNGVYDRAGFEIAIDYNLDPVPKLKPEDASWASELLRECIRTASRSQDLRNPV
jgi:Protein of unknown function (DUF4058)